MPVYTTVVLAQSMPKITGGIPPVGRSLEALAETLLMALVEPQPTSLPTRLLVSPSKTEAARLKLKEVKEIADFYLDIPRRKVTIQLEICNLKSQSLKLPRPTHK